MLVLPVHCKHEITGAHRLSIDHQHHKIGTWTSQQYSRSGDICRTTLINRLSPVDYLYKHRKYDDS